MVSTWASTALNIPELVDMIMAFLHHDKCTLVLCARVSKLWGHAAVRFLWDEVNAYEVAHALIGSTDHRRQHCLQQIRQLDFSPPKSGAHLQSRAVLHRFFFGLELPKLCKLKTTGWYASNEDAVISQYFNNRLTDLYLSCTTHPDTFLDHLQVFTKRRARDYSDTDISLGSLSATCEFGYRSWRSTQIYGFCILQVSD